MFKPALVVSDGASREAILLDGAVWPLPLLLRKVVPVLRRGLEKRVKLLTILPQYEAKVGLKVTINNTGIMWVVFFLSGYRQRLHPL